jgi:toxin ParE1/3/4
MILPEAEQDMARLYDYVKDVAGVETARNYIDRIGALLAGLDLAPERGRLRDEVRPGLRVIGFKKKVTVAFTVEEENVKVLRIFSGGQDWQQIMRED